MNFDWVLNRLILNLYSYVFFDDCGECVDLNFNVEIWFYMEDLSCSRVEKYLNDLKVLELTF